MKIAAKAATQTMTRPSDWPSRDRQDDPIRIGQRVRLLRDSRAKLLWDRASYSAQAGAGAEGVVVAYELLDRDGYLTTEAIQEIRGYPGTPAYEVTVLVPGRGVRSDPLEEAWVYVPAEALTLVNADRARTSPKDSIEDRLRSIAEEALRPVPPVRQVGPARW